MNLRNVLSGTLGLILMTTVSYAQTNAHKLGVSAGGGPLDYKSSIGNGFSLKKGNSWHGAIIVQAGSYLTQSFDLVFFGSMGDLGPSRLNTVGVSLKYKFADDHLLPESSTLKPYVYAGIAFNNLTNKIKVTNAHGGNYMSFNGGLGIRYYIRERISIGYNLALGYFITESTDFASQRYKNELYLHNALMLGYDLF